MPEYSVCDMGAIAYLLYKGFRHSALKPTGDRGQLAFISTDPAARDEVTNYFCGATIRRGISAMLCARPRRSCMSG
jgi:hypothetical protein